MPTFVVGEEEPEDVPTPGTACRVCLADPGEDHQDWCPEKG